MHFYIEPACDSFLNTSDGFVLLLSDYIVLHHSQRRSPHLHMLVLHLNQTAKKQLKSQNLLDCPKLEKNMQIIQAGRTRLISERKIFFSNNVIFFEGVRFTDVRELFTV